MFFPLSLSLSLSLSFTFSQSVFAPIFTSILPLQSFSFPLLLLSFSLSSGQFSMLLFCQSVLCDSFLSLSLPSSLLLFADAQFCFSFSKREFNYNKLLPSFFLSLSPPFLSNRQWLWIQTQREKERKRNPSAQYTFTQQHITTRIDKICKQRRQESEKNHDEREKK